MEATTKPYHDDTLSVVMMGATGAVGTCVVNTFKETGLKRLALLGRRPLANADAPFIQQHTVDVLQPASYSDLLSGYDCAICTLGVGQPSKIDKQTFIKIDKLAVIDFATACKEAGVKHFQLLSSVGSHPQSLSFYLRCKGELEDALKALGFERLSIFKPSMILTPTNRYGFSQALTLKVWPWLDGVLQGNLRQYRGIKIADLGRAIALNSFKPKTVYECLTWVDFRALIN